jgi:ABC-2 type transport system permease protein
MSSILGAEWRRLLAERANRRVLGLLGMALFASALSSGLDARAWHLRIAQMDAQWASKIAMARTRDMPQSGSPQAAMQAFQVARNDAPVAVLPPLGGLALGSGAFEVLAPAVRVTVESRHSDGRKEERLSNPLLQGFGVPDFSTSVALLVPLAIICLCAGMVQHGRELGVWRVAVVQCARPGIAFATSLALRAVAVGTIATLASMLAFWLDPGATALALVYWGLGLAGLIAVWTVTCALVCLVRISSSSAVLATLGLWLLTTFAVPMALAWWADRHAPMPSRLAAVVQLRNAQQRAESQMDKLLAAWYEAHPAERPAGRSSHTWPVSFLPRYQAQEAEVGPLMLDFDRQRARRYESVAPWAWLSPSLSMTMLADELAGIDAPRYARYMDSVAEYEAQWRDFFLPRIMSYRGLGDDDLARLPRFAGVAPEQEQAADASDGWRHGVALLLLALAGAGVVAAMRRRLQAA